MNLDKLKEAVIKGDIDVKPIDKTFTTRIGFLPFFVFDGCKLACLQGCSHGGTNGTLFPLCHQGCVLDCALSCVTGCASGASQD